MKLKNKKGQVFEIYSKDVYNQFLKSGNYTKVVNIPPKTKPKKKEKKIEGDLIVE